MAIISRGAQADTIQLPENPIRWSCVRWKFSESGQSAELAEQPESGVRREVTV